MSDFSYIKPVIDLTCWTNQETAAVIDGLDNVIQKNKIPADGTLILRHVLIKLLDQPEIINPVTFKPEAVFNKLCLSPEEDLINLFGQRVGPICYLYCKERGIKP